jgi:hypothetical protein
MESDGGQLVVMESAGEGAACREVHVIAAYVLADVENRISSIPYSVLKKIAMLAC